MPISNSPLAYEDCYEALNRALEDARGVRLKVNSRANAEFLRMRLNMARVINRDQNTKTYDSDHPMHGRSEYDKLMFRIKEIKNGSEVKVYVYLEQVATFHPEVEELSTLENEGEEVKTKPEPLKIESLVIRKKEEETIPINMPVITRRL